MELERLELERLELEGERGGSEEDIFQVTGGGQKERYPGDYDRRCMNFATGLFLVVVCCCVVVFACCICLFFVSVLRLRAFSPETSGDAPDAPDRSRNEETGVFSSFSFLNYTETQRKTPDTDEYECVSYFF